MATAAISAPPRAAARSTCPTSSRSPRRPTIGYYGVLLPTGRSCEDSWVVASALAPLTQRLRFLVAVRPGLQSPTLAARMTSTLDRISGGRLLINVVTGGDPVENKGDGIFLSHDERYEVTREFLDIYKAVLRGEDRAFKASISASRTAGCCSRRCRRRIRRSISAARRRRPTRSPPSRSTNISPGANRRQMSPPRLIMCAALAEKAGRKVTLRHPPACHRPRNQ